MSSFTALFRIPLLVCLLLASSHASQKGTAPAAPDKPTPNVAAQAEALPPTTDPREIVRRAAEIDHHTAELARNYTCQNREVINHLDKHGEVKSTEVKTYDINFYYGEEYARLVQENDKPLSEKEQKKEDEKLEKFLTKYRNESAEDREKRLAKEKKEREQGRAFLRDVVNAYDFRLIGEELVDNAEAYVIEAIPRQEFKPTQPHADMLKKLRGRLWIEKNNYNWVKVDAEVTDTVAFGLFLVRFHPGSHFTVERTLLNNEVWLPKTVDLHGGARIAIFKNINIAQQDVFSNYKKFVTSVKVVPADEIPSTPPK